MVPPSTGLPPAAWSADADVGAERRNPVPYRGHRDVLRADAPPKARWATSNAMEAQRANGEAAAARILVATRRPGNPPVSDEASEPWRVALQAGPEGTLPGRADEAQRWQARRAETGLAAAVARRHAAAAALDGKRKGVKGTLAALLRLRPSRVARRRIAHFNSATPPPRGRVMQPRGAIDRASRPRTGGAQSVR